MGHLNHENVIRYRMYPGGRLSGSEPETMSDSEGEPT